MTSMQLLTGVLIALAVLAGTVTALSAAMLAAASVARHGQAPHGRTLPGLPQHPQPDTDSARVLVLR